MKRCWSVFRERRGVAGCTTRAPADPRVGTGEAGPGCRRGRGAPRAGAGREGGSRVGARSEPPEAPRGGGTSSGLRAGWLGRRRRLREHESAAAATAATAVEGARWPISGPGDPALLTAAAETRCARGSRRRGPQRRPRTGPRPSRGPPLSSLLLRASSLLSPPLSLAGRARHGAASPPMALRRSMGRLGLPPLPLPPPPPPPLLLLASLAALLLAEPAAAGRGWSGGGGTLGAAEGRGRVGAEEPQPSRASPGPGRAGELGGGTGAGRPRLGATRGGGVGSTPGPLPALGPGPHPQLSRVRGSSGGRERSGAVG